MHEPVRSSLLSLMVKVLTGYITQNRSVGSGSTGLVELLPGGTRVKKAVTPLAPEHMRAYVLSEMRREIEIYNHLPKGHPRILDMLLSYDTGDDAGIELEYLPNGTLDKYLDTHASDVSPRLRARWCLEATTGVALLHAHDVVHADIRPSNMLVDQQRGVRIIDFSGSKFRGKRNYCMEAMHYGMAQTPGDPTVLRRTGADITTDLFALGCSLYHIVTGSAPYQSVLDKVVEALYFHLEFPPLQNDDGRPLLFANLIDKCWHAQLGSATALLAALQAETLAYFDDDDVDYIEETSGIRLRLPNGREDGRLE